MNDTTKSSDTIEGVCLGLTGFADHDLSVDDEVQYDDKIFQEDIYLAL